MKPPNGLASWLSVSMSQPQSGSSPHQNFFLRAHVLAEFLDRAHSTDPMDRCCASYRSLATHQKRRCCCPHLHVIQTTGIATSISPTPPATTTKETDYPVLA